MARKIITGDAELEKTLRSMADKSADRVTRAALGGALSTVAKEIRKAAPVGKTGNLKGSIGSRFEKGSKNNAPTAKAGINVGKRTKRVMKRLAAGKSAPHAHLVGLGTKKRFREDIGGKFAYMNQDATQEQTTTGAMPSNPFVRQAYEVAKSKMGAAMRKRAAKALEREARKATK